MIARSNSREAGCAVDLRRARLFRVLVVCLVSAVLAGCGDDASRGKDPKDLDASTPKPAEPTAAGARIMETYRSLDSSKSSVMKLEARVTDTATGSSRAVRLTMYRKRDGDGRQEMLFEFTSPPEERDRDGLVIVTPPGEVEAIRYMQSTDKFVATTSATGEDSLFGMSLQELLGGQPEKYDHRLVEETIAGNVPANKLEGTLKPGADSRFQRVVLLMAKDTSAALSIELYDSRDELARRVTVERSEQVSGYWTRMRWTVDNIAHGKKIEFTTLSARYDQKLDGSIFSREHLKRISTR
jgi:hypothetical protein